MANFLEQLVVEFYEFRGKRVQTAAIPEGFPLLRTIQFTLQHVVQR